MNYLVNTLDLMNRCEVWNGQLFKVCGIWFSGDYVINGKEGNTEDLRCVYGDTTDESHVIRGSKTTDKFKVINKTESQKIITIYLNVHFKPVETLHFKGHIAEEFMWEFDIISSDCGATVDGNLTDVVEVDGKQLVKVVAWYDNEMGYSYQMVRTAEKLSKLI